MYNVQIDVAWGIMKLRKMRPSELLYFIYSFIYSFIIYLMLVFLSLIIFILRLSQFSQFFHAMHGAVCIQLTHLSYYDCENRCTLSRGIYPIIIIKSKVWSIFHCLGSGHETMVCVVCLSTGIFLFIFHSLFSVSPFFLPSFLFSGSLFQCLHFLHSFFFRFPSL